MQTLFVSLLSFLRTLFQLQAGLSDKDLADLMSYLQERCCWDEHPPPANSHYAYGKK